MKDFSNASFPPDTIEVMTLAMNAALATLSASSQFKVCSIGS
jgi:hypothetical protein